MHRFVDVPFVDERFVDVRFVDVPFVDVRFVDVRFVDVRFGGQKVSKTIGESNILDCLCFFINLEKS